MNRKNLFTVALTTVSTLLLFNTAANADHDRDNPYVNYDLLCESADGLQYVANDLKECFSAEFRHTGQYGKLASRSSRIKNTAKRLHRRGISQSTCNWRSEIQSLDDLVCDLRTVVRQSASYSRGCEPIHPATLRKVRSLLVKAEYYVQSLERSLQKIEYTSGSSCYQQRPVNIKQPVRYNDVAPAYAPRNGVGNRNRNYQPASRATYTRHNDRGNRSSYGNTGFDLGALRFLLQ